MAALDKTMKSTEFLIPSKEQMMKQKELRQKREFYNQEKMNTRLANKCI